MKIDINNSDLSPDERYKQTIYLLKVIFENSFKIAQIALVHKDSHHVKRLEEYINGFITFLHSITSEKDYIVFEKFVNILPHNLDGDSLMEILDRGTMRPNIEDLESECMEKFDRLFKKYRINYYELPVELSRTISYINSLEIPEENSKTEISNAYYNLEQSLKKANDEVQGRIVIKNDGSVYYYLANGKMLRGEIKPKTNPYYLLQILSMQVGQFVKANVIEAKFNKERVEANQNDPVRRVHNAIKEVRLQLKISKDNDIFRIGRKEYAIKYPVIFEE